MDKKPGPGEINIDEKWLMEWFDWGWQHLLLHLSKRAAFDVWCASHERSLDG